MPFVKPFNLMKWVDENRDLFQPPVGNQQVYKISDDFIVMVVGGPNGRKDYHWEEGEELFYQLVGDIEVGVIHEDGTREDVQIKEGEIFLLPARMPHSPRRSANTIGLVVERSRREGEIDKLMWFCESCNCLLHEAKFELKNIVTELPVLMNEFMDSESLRTCSACGSVMEKPA